MTQPRRYRAYMLRLWQVDGEGGPTWRASLESPHTGERHGFASLEALFTFLAEQVNAELDHPASRKEKPMIS